MKIRILDNSIRLRFSQTELKQLADEGKILRKLQVSPSKAFVYGLYKTNTDTKLTADMNDGGIQVFIPEFLVDELVQTERVGVEERLNFGEQSLKLLVEKDFKCLTKRDEDESDLFEHPETNGHQC